MMRRNAAGLLVLASVCVGAEANAQSYTRTSSNRPFSSIRLTGSVVSLTDYDEGYGSITAPFTFALHGSTVSSGSTLYVGSNGTLHINSQIADYINLSLPNASAPNGFAAPFWDDLYLLSGGVYQQTQGSVGSRVLVVEWYNASHYNAQNDFFTFQLRIYEGTNVVEFHYGPRTAPNSWDGTIGIENASGTDAISEFCSPSCHPFDVAEGTVITLTPSGTAGSPDFSITYVQTPPSSIQAGSFATLDFEIYNGGSAFQSTGEVALYAGISPTVTASDYQLAYATFGTLSSGGYAYGTLSINVPTGLSGTYYLAVIVDPYQLVTESNESNNTYALGSILVTGGGGASIIVTTTSLPGATVGEFYSTQLQQSGAFSPYWSVVSGSLPSGLSLSSSGVISGYPTVSGFYSFRVQAEESGLIPGTADLSINVGSGGTIQIVTGSLPPAEVGVPYSARIEAVGGAPPYAFQIIEGRPSWLVLDSAGNFSGTPDAEGSHLLTISVFDSNFADASTVMTLDVVQPQALFIETNLPPGVTGREYSQRVVKGGVPPYQTTIVNGTLPPGLSIDSFGQLAGVPTMQGTFNFTVQATDANTPQGSVEQAVTLEIVELTELEIASRDITIYVNADIDQELTAKGGVPPYTWTMLGGALLPGLTFDPAGRLTGRVDKIGNTVITLQVSDAEGATAQAEVNIRATLYRSSGGGRGGGRRGGCVCALPGEHGGSGLFWLAVLGLLLVGRVERRRGHTRSATPH